MLVTTYIHIDIMSSANNSPPSHKKGARQRILEAAAESFQSLGYARTTTQVIATKAGVAEVTLFRHFGDKQKLFQAVAHQIGGGPNLDKVEAQLTYDLETDLRFISQHTLRFFLAQQDAIRMLMFESIHFPEMKAALAQNPRGMIELLERYFQKQIDAGNLQKVDPQVTAQSFLSMIFGYAIGMHPVRDLLPAEIPVAEITAEFVRIFLAALKK
jgi:AcrR family transcriptional regulator